MSHRLRAVAVIASLYLVSGDIPALAKQPEINCDTAATTPELNRCAEIAFEEADAKLNDAYKKSIEFVRKVDAPKPYDAASWEKALRTSQKAWVAFREADCKGRVPMSWGGGTGTTASVLYCMMVKTETRTKELIDIYSAD